jgi:hypothetical protein
MLPGLALSLLGILSLAITLGTASGVTIGTLTWQPVFAGGILLIVGMNAIVLGMASHMYAVSRGIILEDGMTEFFRNYVTLERVLGLALLFVLAGVALDGVIFYEWLTESNFSGTEGMAAVAQTSIIVGANLALGGFLLALMDVE